MTLSQSELIIITEYHTIIMVTFSMDISNPINNSMSLTFYTYFDNFFSDRILIDDYQMCTVQVSSYLRKDVTKISVIITISNICS